MKKYLITVFLLSSILFVIQPCADETSGLAPADLIFWKVTKAYNAKNFDDINKMLWFNSPWGYKIIAMVKNDFSSFDSITFEVLPLSVVYYKRMGYDNVEARALEKLKAYNIKEKTYQESTSNSVFKIIKDEVGNYYIMNWERNYLQPMIKIEKK